MHVEEIKIAEYWRNSNKRNGGATEKRSHKLFVHSVTSITFPSTRTRPFTESEPSQLPHGLVPELHPSMCRFKHTLMR